MQKYERTKSGLVVILLIFLIALSIAYATLTQYLYINSQAIVAGQSTGWNVRFSSVTCQANGTAAITHDFTMNSTNLSGLVSRFTAPGDSIVCNIDVTNSGTINAKLSSFIIQDGSLTYTGSGTNKTADENLVTGKLQHSIVYATGDVKAGQVPSVDDTLPVGVTRSLVLTITYPSNADLPDSDVSVAGLKTTFLYSQN